MKARHKDNRGGFGLVTGLVVVAVLLAAAGAGLLVAYSLSKGTAQSVAQASTGGDFPDSAPAMEFVEFGPVVANLAEGKLTRYLKVDITLQVGVSDASTVRALLDDGEKAVFKNWLIGYLSDKKRDEVTGTTNINRLRREIQDGFNAILADTGEYKVESVLFTEFNVQ